MISVIMPCWIVNDELEQLTRDAVDSLGDVFLIIIDNASSQGGGYLRSVADVYIRNSENLGYAKAVNQGLALTTSEYVAVANNDIRVSPNWQEVVVDIFRHNMGVGSVHPRMIEYDEPFEYGDKTVLTGKERWCTGSFFVLKKHGAFQKYDETFLNSYDDWDYFKRLRDNSFYTVYTDKACYQHKDSTSQQLIKDRPDREVKNATWFMKKHGDTAENLFAKQYPEQMKVGWREGFKL